MHLSPIKGAFPHKDQHDRTAPVAIGSSIERGTVIRINGETGEFEVAEDASVYPMYLAIQRYDDLQAAMAGIFTPASGTDKLPNDPDFPEDKKFKYEAGKFPRGAGKYSNDVLQGFTRPAISGIHMDDGDVWETDMFDTDDSVDWDGASLNAKLTVKDGLITLADGDSAESEGIVGFLVKKPYKRYCNDATAVKDMMTGAYRYVIQFQCGK